MKRASFPQQSKIAAAGLAEQRHREYEDHASFTATEVKNEFGRILEKAIQGETVVITKHHAAKAVLISVDQFNAQAWR